MSRIVGVLNHKGGTGKTTTVVNLATGLAAAGEHVLCIDVDPQGSLGTCFGVAYTATLAELILGKATLAQTIVRVQPNLDLIASDRQLLQAEGALWRLPDTQMAHQVLSGLLPELTEYSFILFDFSPSVSLLGQSALLAVQELIVPVAMNYLSLMGTRQVLETLKQLGRIEGHRLKLGAVVPTFYYGRLRKDREVLAKLQYYFKGKVATPIRANVKLAEAAGHQMSIYDYAPRSTGAEDYGRLVQQVKAYG